MHSLLKMKALECSMAADVRMVLTTLLCIPIGYLIGSIFRELNEVQTDTFYSPLASSNPGYSEHIDSGNMSKVDIASNPCKGAGFAQRLVKGPLDFSLQVSLNVTEITNKPKYLLAIAVGIRQRDVVNKTVAKFSEEFAIMLFHYDGKTSEWDQFEWSQRAIHITGLNQTKWWFAKRFLHPDVVTGYEYIFIWDEDLGVDNFSSEEYIKLAKKYDLEISQPAITSTRLPIYKITMKRHHVEVHKDAKERCVNRLLPPCAGFVEIMAPVFSRKSWNCVWGMIQNDLVHGWGLDFAFWRCVETPHERIGVVDAQWIQHLVLPTLGSQGESKKKIKRGPRSQARARSFFEWKEFERRMKEAEEHQL